MNKIKKFTHLVLKKNNRLEHVLSHAFLRFVEKYKLCRNAKHYLGTI